tara:strand:- start:312 stop:542 length:231 start_codon:yes stop_codon:yes gene_type:complete
MLSTIQTIDFGRQALTEALTAARNWHRARGSHITEDRLQDFSAGFSQGWREAIATLKLHGYTFPDRPIPPHHNGEP